MMAPTLQRDRHGRGHSVPRSRWPGQRTTWCFRSCCYFETTSPSIGTLLRAVVMVRVSRPVRTDENLTILSTCGPEDVAGPIEGHPLHGRAVPSNRDRAVREPRPSDEGERPGADLPGGEPVTHCLVGVPRKHSFDRQSRLCHRVSVASRGRPAGRSCTLVRTTPTHFLVVGRAGTEAGRRAGRRDELPVRGRRVEQPWSLSAV